MAMEERQRPPISKPSSVDVRASETGNAEKVWHIAGCPF